MTPSSPGSSEPTMRWSSRTLQVCTVGPQLGVVLRTNAAAPGTEVIGDLVAFSVPVTWTSLHSCSAPSQQSDLTPRPKVEADTGGRKRQQEWPVRLLLWLQLWGADRPGLA